MTILEIVQTDVFEAWLDGLRDRRARDAVTDRLERVQAGNLGDHASVGGGVSELRLHHGPGYRIYYAMRGKVMVILLVGGTKASQHCDIRRGQDMVRKL